MAKSRDSFSKRELKLERQRDALRAAKGAWKAGDHTELAGGAASWVREIRQESVKRFEKIEHQYIDPQKQNCH
jgi:hypothetical protein